MIKKYLIIDRRGDTLILGLEGGRTYTNVTLEAQISMPSLRVLDLSGASEVRFSQFDSSDPFEIFSSGSGLVEGDIQAGNVTIRLSGSSDLRLAGSGQDLTLNASGSSMVDLEQFEVDNATLDISGSGDVIVNVEGVSNVFASGSSNITFVGNPTMGEIRNSGSSSIQGK